MPARRRRRPGQESRDVPRLADFLSRRLAALADTDEVRAYRAWRAAAGEQIAAVTNPARITRGTLLVECDSAVWAQELTYLGPQILERLRAADPDTPVQRLRFVSRGGRR
jgi:predicted nucleic acid-binding Zn ribbon protein